MTKILSAAFALIFAAFIYVTGVQAQTATPTIQPTATTMPTSTVTPTVTGTNTPTPTETMTPTPTATRTPTPTQRPVGGSGIVVPQGAPNTGYGTVSK